MQQCQQVALRLATMAINAFGRVELDRKVAVLAVAAGRVEDAVHPVLARAGLAEWQTVVLQHQIQRCVRDEFVDVVHVATIIEIHASGSKTRL